MVAMPASERLSLDEVVAIDVHAHVEMSKAGGDSLPDELRDAAVKHFRGQSARPTAVELARVLPRTPHDGRRLYRRRRVDHRTARGCRTRRSPRSRGERRRADPVREHRPAQGAARRRRGAPPDRRPRRARLQVPPQRAGVLPERPPGLPALRGDRGGTGCRRSSTPGTRASARACPGAAASGSSTPTRSTSTTSPWTSPT